MESQQAVVGVDLGGTNVRAQVIRSDGRPGLLRPISAPSQAQNGLDATLDAVAQVVKAAIADAGEPVRAVGLAIPGHVDNASGEVRWAPNFGEYRDGVFYYWQHVAVRGPLEKRLGLPVVMGNDANCAALGEYQFGSGEGKAKCLLMFTLGTGVGGGVVLGPGSVDGQASGPLLLVGGNKGGVELGHTLIAMGGMLCNSGAYGALEAYGQAEGLTVRAQNKLKRRGASIMNDWVKGDLSLVTPKLVAEAADVGDPLARRVWDEYGTYLGAGVGSLINVFAPDVVAIGGQIAKAWPHFAPALTMQARDIAVPSLMDDVRIVRAQRLRSAGILGAAALARQLA
ncbi:MAG: ROK family protein [Armatimonadota bacterium]|jgi:glucokinase|nr:ROK family protein [Fimbriimonadaceae bacterium]